MHPNNLSVILSVLIFKIVLIRANLKNNVVTHTFKSIISRENFQKKIKKTVYIFKDSI